MSKREPILTSEQERELVAQVGRREPSVSSNFLDELYEKAGISSAQPLPQKVNPPIPEREDVPETLLPEQPSEVSPAQGDIAEPPTTSKRISSRQRRLSLEEYRTTYLQVPKIEDRKPVFVSREVRDRLDEIVRRLGGRRMSVSGLLENIARLHISTYGDDIEQWRKL